MLYVASDALTCTLFWPSTGWTDCMLTTPAGALRPNSVPCGPRNISTSCTSKIGKPFSTAFSWSTSSYTNSTGWEAKVLKSVLP